MTPAQEKTPIRAVIALGSNIHDRSAHLQHAVDRFRDDKYTEVIEISGVYESPPEGENLTGEFLNTVIILDTELSPMELLELCHEIEVSEGRDRNLEKRLNSRNRTLDCDVIFYGDIKINDEGLEIPHPKWHSRPFVVLPLIDVKEALTGHQKRLLEDYASEQNHDSASCHRAETVLH